MDNRRATQRKRLNYYVTVRDRITDRPVGRVVDITNKGLRIFSEIPIEMDKVLQLTMELPHEIEGSRYLMFDATGIWCGMDLNPDFPGFFDTGLEMINVSQQDRTMILGLIREYTYQPTF